MTEEIKEEFTEEVTQNENEQPIEEVIEEAIDESKFDSAGDPDVVKVNLDMPPPEQKKEEVVEEQKENVEKETVEEVIVEEATQQPVMEEVTEEEKVEEVAEAVEEAVEEAVATGKPLPENIQKLVDFMDETGGDINDYVQLNRDVSKMDDSDVLDEYYRSTKPHLTAEERNFLMEDTFSYDEEIDDEKTKRKKKIALKEQVAEARAHLDRQKSKYYEEIKAGSRLTEDQQKAINFYNESEKQKEQSKKSKRTFLNKTDSFFGQDFKGFEYNVGDKKYRFNVKDVNKVKEAQSDINNFISKFSNKEKTELNDAAGYHKSLFTAMNPDAIAKHFYEQGKADAIKDQIAKNKNIDLNPRKTHGETNVGGVKYRVLGQSSSDIKNRSFKIRKKN
jgi:hypothetical protein